MQNYQSVVANILATRFTSPVVSAAQEEEGKAQLTRLAAYEIWLTNPNLGLVAKDSGNQVAGLTVDVLMDRTDGSAADCASSTPDSPGNVRITTPWSPYAVNTDPNWLNRWRQPTAALAAMGGPMPRTDAPGPGPDPEPEPGPDDDVIINMLDDITQMLTDQASTLADMRAQQAADTATIVANDNANTQKIQEQIHQVVEDMEESLKQALVLILAMRQPDDGGGILPDPAELAASVIAAARERRAQHPPNLADAAEMLWTVVANVSGGDWKQQSLEWQEAAARWRDYYFQTLPGRITPARPPTAPPPTDPYTQTLLNGDTVPVLRGDVSAIIAILEQYVDCPDVWGDCIARLRRAQATPPEER